MKRKASDFEESNVCADWSFDYSSSASTASPESVRATSDHTYGLGRTYPQWNTGSIPYQNSRTRKRYRDGRPDEGTIHQNTLAKLFNAQRQMRQETQSNSWQINLPSGQHMSDGHSDHTIPSWSGPAISMGEPLQNQRSIDSFFGGARGSRSNVHIQKLQPASFGFSAMQDAPSLGLTCEDCNNILQSTNERTFVSEMDAMSMDIGSQADEWACASCSRRVCDICAVRGDHRICLECAVPGGG